MLRKQQRHTVILIVAISLLAGMFSTCSKSPKCWGESKNKGIINSSISIACEPLADQHNFIINDDSAYHQTFSQMSQFCSPLPTIDFNAYSLLGLYADGQCEVKFIRDVRQLENENRYHYKVTVKSCGLCKKNVYSYNWVTVPKISNSWSVTFEVESK